MYNIDIIELFNNAFKDLYVKKENKTLNQKDFAAIWGIGLIITLCKLEGYITNSEHTNKGYTCDDAIIYGHLCRLLDLLNSQYSLVVNGVATRELLSIIERCILETVITLEYLLRNQSFKLFDDYRMASLKMTNAYETEVLNTIALNNNVKTPIEESILNSIEDEYSKLNVTRQDIIAWSTKNSILPGFFGRFRAVGKERVYNIAYKGKSQSIHGNWEALSKSYMTFNAESNRFHPKLSEISMDVSRPVDIRQLNPLLLFSLEVVKLFLTNYNGHGFDIQAELVWLDFLCKDLIKLEDEHEVFLGR